MVIFIYNFLFIKNLESNIFLFEAFYSNFKLNIKFGKNLVYFNNKIQIISLIYQNQNQ